MADRSPHDEWPLPVPLDEDQAAERDGPEKGDIKEKVLECNVYLSVDSDQPIQGIPVVVRLRDGYRWGIEKQARSPCHDHREYEGDEQNRPAVLYRTPSGSW